VLVRDATGRVVAKASRQYPLSGRLESLDEARAAKVLFYRELRLPAGRYSLEAVAADARSGRAGTAVATLEVPPTEPGRLRVSSLMVVHRAEKVTTGEGAEPGPLQYKDVLLYPDLGQPMRREAGRPVAFFLSAWPASGRERSTPRWSAAEGRPVAPPRRSRAAAADGQSASSTFPSMLWLPGLRSAARRRRPDAATRTAGLALAPDPGKPLVGTQRWSPARQRPTLFEAGTSLGPRREERLPFARSPDTWLARASSRQPASPRMRRPSPFSTADASRP
jgi:hypothetical protein